MRKHLAATIVLSAGTVLSAAQTSRLCSGEDGASSRAPRKPASGEAKIEGKKISLEIDARFQGLEDATKFGLEYLTYVLWAVSPQGRAVNLGELTLDHGKGHVKAFTDMQARLSGPAGNFSGRDRSQRLREK